MGYSAENVLKAMKKKGQNIDQVRVCATGRKAFVWMLVLLRNNPRFAKWIEGSTAVLTGAACSRCNINH